MVVQGCKLVDLWTRWDGLKWKRERAFRSRADLKLLLQGMFLAKGKNSTGEKIPLN